MAFLSQLAVALPEEQNPEDPFDTVMTQLGPIQDDEAILNTRGQLG